MKMGFSLQPSTQLVQRLELILNPKTIMMLRMLNLPYTGLLDTLSKATEENVMLEMERPDGLLEYARNLRGTAVGRTAEYDTSAPEKEMAAAEKTLAEHLIDQLRLECLSEQDTQIGEYLINSMDERGYLPNYSELKDDIIKKFEVGRTKPDQILKVIQTLEPEGVGARTLKECLYIQIEEYNFENEALRAVLKKAVHDHLDDLAKKNYAKISEALSIPLDGAQNLAKFIEENLNPNPASSFGPARSHQLVIPSFAVEKKDNDYVITNLEATKGPQLNISQNYLKILEDPKTDEQTLTFLKEKFEAAKNMIDNINNRQEMIAKVVDLIVKNQHDFLEQGHFWMNPLLQKKIAELVGVHPSTVSRAIAEKYIQTPQGIYSLKFLCARDFKGHTAQRLKLMIGQIIRDNPNMSDQKISDMLLTKSIDVKRRTVAKYRSELGLASSFERR
jgi:RNA polymerase sigma-54 factor